MRRALLTFAVLIGMFLTIGCTSPESDDTMDGDDEPAVDDDNLGVDESSEAGAEVLEGSPGVQITGDTIT